MRICVINVDGTIEVKDIESDLETLQALVGGDIEGLTLAEDVYAYINEDGKALDLEANPLASAMVEALLQNTGRTFVEGDWISGPLVVVGPADEDGNDTEVPEWFCVYATGVAQVVSWMESQLGLTDLSDVVDSLEEALEVEQP